jgi:hypothetical protein
MVDPIFEYAHGTQIPGTTSPTSCNCISGGAFVPNGLWPGYDGSYLFGECTCGGIFRIDPAGSLTSANDFASSLGTVVHLTFGPSGSRQALYYTTFNSGGQVRRIDGPLVTGSSQYHTVAPCRLADTRQPNGPFGGPAFTGGEIRTWIAAGSCGIPASAVAVAINLTVTSPTAGGNLTVYPAGSAVPGTSTLNFSAGQTRANNAIVQLGASDGFNVLCSMPGGTAHVLVDVVGYFE